MNFINKRIRVIVADDHELVRRGFQTLLLFNDEIELVAHVANGEELYAAVKIYLPDVVITDIKMPVLNGIEATKLIKTDYPNIKVIALSSYIEKALIDDVLEAGADGYLIKNISKEELIKSIHSVIEGKPYFCELSLEIFLERKAEQQQPKIDFSKREIEVMRLIAAEKSYREIADILNISIRTVEGHGQSLRSKIGVSNNVGVAVFAIKNGYCNKQEKNN
jgi:DNA-binding NarL/FixJ family response regulator